MTKRFLTWSSSISIDKAAEAIHMLKNLGHGSASNGLSDYAFQKIREHAEEEISLFLDDTKRSMIIRRLSPRLKQLGLDTFDEYVDRIDECAQERTQFLSLLTTNLTSFFREAHHFELMAKEWLPRLMETARDAGQVRIWSTACSSGEEAYSLAITVLEHCPNANELDVKILATDADPHMVETASKGIYTEEQLNKMSPVLRQKYFVANEQKRNSYAVRQTVKSIISFARLDITNEWPMRKLYDVIFCRNVAIYFKEEVQQKLWADLAAQMNKSGLLCIGHSERVAGPAQEILKPLGKTAYVKK